MLVTLNGKRYHITWSHIQFPVRGGVTECFIYEYQADGTKQLIIKGHADCSHKDQYDKNLGRKLSLERALLTRVPDQSTPKVWNPVFDHESRKAVWAEYFRMRGGKY